MESSEHNWANISKTICPGMLIFDKWAFWMLFFHNTPKKDHNLTDLIFYDITL